MTVNGGVSFWFGASGRNGGWLTNTISGGRDAYAKTFGWAAVVAFQNALNDTVARGGLPPA